MISASELRQILLSVFLASVGLSSVYLIPAFAESLGASYLQLGYIGTIRAIPYMFLPVIFGYLGDRFGRRHLYFSSIFITGLGTLSMGLTGTVDGILALQLVLGIGFSSFWPVSEALVSEVAQSGRQAAAMGAYGVAWASGFLVGPLIVGYLASAAGFPLMFLIAGASVLTVAVVSSMTVRGTQTSRYGQMKADTSSRRGLVSELVPFLMIQLPYGFVFSFIVAILPGHAAKSGLTPFEVGVLLSAFGLARIGAFSQAGRFAKFGERRSIILASAGITFALFVAPSSSSFFGFLADILLLGLFLGIFYPQVVGYIGRRTPSTDLGFSMGMYETAVGIGFALGPFASGFVAQGAGVYVTYVVLSAVAFSMIPMAALAKPR